MFKLIDSTSFYTKFLSGDLQRQRTYGIVTIEPAGQANGFKVTIVDANYEIADATELSIGGEVLCSTARIALKPGCESRKVTVYVPEIPAGTGPTFCYVDDVLAEVNAEIEAAHEDFPLSDFAQTQLEQVKALKPGESVRWEIEGDEYFIICNEVAVEELVTMHEFNGY